MGNVVRGLWYPFGMTVKARVHKGRLLLDEPTQLPEGTVVDLLPLDPGDWLDPADRAALHRALVASQEDVAAGRLIDAEEVLRGCFESPCFRAKMPGMGYPSDVTDAEWNVIASLLPAAKPGGRPRTTSVRDVINAIFYVSRGGGAWRMLPKDFPPYQTVYRYYRAWSKDGTWQRVHDALRDRVRQKEGREISPSAAAIDSQSAKTTEKGAPEATTRGKKSKGASGISSSTRWD